MNALEWIFPWKPASISIEFLIFPHFEGLQPVRSQLDFSSESPVCQAFNLYHANFWVIEPATAGHGRGGCSYVELVATSAQMQRPLWQLGSWNWWENMEFLGKHGMKNGVVEVCIPCLAGAGVQVRGVPEVSRFFASVARSDGLLGVCIRQQPASAGE